MNMPPARTTPTGKLARQDLMSLEKYAEVRNEFRQRVIAHKQQRQVQVGPHARLYFEDKLTIQYQVQEMLRIERIFEAAGIDEELHAYNPLIPDGTNLKATFMLEYDDPNARKAALAELIGIEDKVWLRVGEAKPVYGIADEDLERANESKTSAVHFVRFDLSADAITKAKQGATIVIGIDHPHYRHETALSKDARAALVRDLA